jgi:hypothetical protein
MLLALAPVTVVPAVHAETTDIFIQLGDTFSGDIEAGVDQVYAHFNAVQGAVVSFSVRATQGSSLQPSLALWDGAGMVDLGDSLSMNGAMKQVRLSNFVIPASGSYVLEVGGSAGAGEFLARTRGRSPNKVDLTTLSGVVTNSYTGDVIAGASVAAGPYRMVTDGSGFYSEDLPVGDYTVLFEAHNYNAGEEMVTLLPRVPSTLDVALEPVAPVIVSAEAAGDAVPDGMLMAMVYVEILDGSTLEEIAWMQPFGAEAIIEMPGAETTAVYLASAADYKNLLFHHLAEPPVGEDDLPPNIEPPEGEFPGGLQNRFEVVGLNPFVLEETALVILEVDITTTSGTYSAEVEVHTHLPWKPTVGIRNVGIGTPVLLHGKEQAAYEWMLEGPSGSSAELIDAEDQNPEFTPDVAGLYELEVTDEATGMPVVLQVYAGTWRGVIVAQDADGRPVSDGNCTGCHGGIIAPDAFTPWAETGHAEIFSDNLNTSTHYGPNCFACHTVGFDPEAANGGIDDAPDYQAFLDAGLINNPGDNWTTMLEEFPAAAQLANIQCENCHGPQSGDPGLDSDAHGFWGPEGEPRVSLSSDTCGVCHGEPPRHGRFQQWQLSGHANYELAIDEGDDGSCSRCHTGNGFLAWLPVLTGDEPGDPTDDITVTWESDDVHPQTCQTCHDPHSIGTSSGDETNATVRISGDTPPLIAGFTAYGVGRGAICMTCHNSRRGLRNDATWPDTVADGDTARAPHGSAQTDVIMGQNAYLMAVGVRGNHSFVTDTCVKCHMEETPPPDIISYNQSGSNHTFAASVDICSNCHGDAFDAAGVQDGIAGALEDIQGLIEGELFDLIAELIGMGYKVDLNGDALILDAADIAEIIFGEARGRQAITVIFVGDDTEFGPYRMSEVDVLDAADTVLGELYDFADERLPKAGWNWNLVNNDGSLGVHNPTFATAALDAARDGLLGIDTAMAMHRYGTRTLPGGFGK